MCALMEQNAGRSGWRARPGVEAEARPAYAWVRINFDGTVEVITGSQDIGTGTRTVMAQIAAEELGLKPEEVTVHLGDTETGPYDPVSWGSMTISSVGRQSARQP